MLLPLILILLLTLFLILPLTLILILVLILVLELALADSIFVLGAAPIGTEERPRPLEVAHTDVDPDGTQGPEQVMHADLGPQPQTRHRLQQKMEPR